jgi:hypothetical protein
MRSLRFSPGLLLAALLGGIVSAAETAGTDRWLAGPALHERLEQAVDVNWSAAPLRPALASLGRTHQVALLLDRRVDPDRRVDAVLHDLPLGAALAEIASREGADVSRLGAVVYIGPPATASRLRTLAELRRREAMAFASGARLRLLSERAMSWDDLAEPRQILERLAAQAGLELAGLERVPHDLWAAADLPPMSLVDRITLVAAQFDLTFSIAPDGRTLRLVPEREQLPVAKADSSMPARPVSARHPRDQKRYTLRQAKGRLSDLLPKLAAMLQVELQIDQTALARAGISLDQLVSLSVNDATADELFAKLLEPAGCTFRREGKTIVVVPKE